MILHDLWTKRSPHTHPYIWLGTEPGELCSEEDARDLAETFPGEGFVRHDQSRRQHKQYRNYSRPLGHPDTERDLTERWRQLLAELLLPAYRLNVARILGQEPARELELRLVRHGQRDGMGPHTDRDEKLFSHIIYLNPTWEEEWGGCLEVLDGDDPNAIVGRVIPRLGASTLMRRADNSWHQVSKVSDACPAERRSLLIHGLR
jgi:Rps23 Pro-64 3,4-dihydroxylase Tpa1-like proline 4-hydroxylase